MTDKEFKRLNRAQLVEIIYELQLEQKQLIEEKEKLEKQLNEQRIEIQKAGSIAQATVGLTHIFEVAQETADKYLAEVYRSTIPVIQQRDEILSEAKQKAEQMIKEAEEKTELQWKEFQDRVDNVLKANSILEKFLNNTQE